MRTRTMLVRFFLNGHEVYPTFPAGKASGTLQTELGRLKVVVTNLDRTRPMQVRLNWSSEDSSTGEVGNEIEVVPGQEATLECTLNEPAQILIIRRFGPKEEGAFAILAAVLGIGKEYDAGGVEIRWTPEHVAATA